MVGSATTSGEEALFRKICWAAAIIVTIALSGLSITGAWIASEGNPFYTAAIAGVELMAFVSLTMIVFATTRLRKIVGWIIFISSVTVCVINAERAIKHSFDLAGSPEVMRQEASILRDRAERQATASAGAEERAIAEQGRLRDEIAKLDLELELMTSATRIEEAQRRLCVLQLYPCDLIDGEREELTLKAMEQRGEAIVRERAIAQKKLDDPGDLTVSEKSDDLLVQAVELEQKADEIDASDTWIRATLAALEMIRSFAVWAFLLKATMVVTSATTRVMESEAVTDAVVADTVKADAENTKGAVEAGERLEELPEPEPEPIPEPEPEPAPVVDPAKRKGGLASQHARQAKKNPVIIPVEDFSEQDLIEDLSEQLVNGEAPQ